MSDSADANHRRALIRSILIFVASMTFLAVCQTPGADWLLGGQVGTIISFSLAAVMAATTIRDIVRWFNRRDDPRSAKLPQDAP